MHIFSANFIHSARNYVLTSKHDFQWSFIILLIQCITLAFDNSHYSQCPI